MPEQIRYVTDPQDAARRVAQLTSEPVLGVDIETTGLDPYQDRTRLMSVATRDGRVAVFDLTHVPVDTLLPLQCRPWAVFNGSFEYRFLTRAGFVVPGLHDAQLLDRLASHQMHRNLGDAARDALGWDLPKEQQTSDWARAELSGEQIQYAGRDALAAVRIAEVLLPKIPRRAYEVWRGALPVLADLELRGLTFDFDGHRTLIAEWQMEHTRLLADLREHLGADTNPNSGRQLSDWLQKHLPKKISARWPRTPAGQMKTDAQTLGVFGDLPAIRPLLGYKKVAKQLSTYAERFAQHAHPVTGRLHPSFRVGQTVSGRVAASRPNVQNPPRLEAFRALFVPPVGQVLVGADYGQIELRVAALLSGDHAMLAAYERGDDLHQLTAAHVAGVPLEEVTKEQRTAAKAVNFGNLFGQGPDGLAKMAKWTYGVDMPPEEARVALREFHSAYPELTIWKQEQIGHARQFRRVVTRSGLIREFDIQGEGFLQGEACNIPIQGSAAEVLLSALGRLPAALKGTSGQLYHNVHDEIVLTADPGDAAHVQDLLKDTMVAGFLDVFPEGEAISRGLVDVHTGPSWAAVH